MRVAIAPWGGLRQKPRQRVPHVAAGPHVDGLQSAGASALNIFNQIVKEQDSMGRHADRVDDVPKRYGLWFAQANIGRHEHLPERAQQVREAIRQAL